MRLEREDAAVRRLRRRIRRRLRIAAFLVGCSAAVAVFLVAVIATAAVSTSSSAAAAGSVATSSTPLPARFEQCSECHDAECAQLAASAHAGLDCLSCHGAHGTGDTRTARESCPDACYRCHPDFRDRSRFHVADGSVTDPLNGRPLTCTSSCHDPHGTAHTAMLRKPYLEGEYGTDGLCLSCHPRVGVDF